MHTFEYLLKSPAYWAESLSQIHNQNHTHLRSQVLWGAHETVPGVRDFSTKSKLHLERYLNLLAERRLTVELVLGFPPNDLTFPEWVWGLSEHAQIPVAQWKSPGEGFSLCEIPALQNPQFKEAFIDFVREVFSIVSLYQVPEGPIKKIYFDFSPYQAQVNLIEGGQLKQGLAARHGQLAELNKRYQTNFLQFDSFLAHRSFNLLNEKRWWLAAYDYRWSRDYAILPLWEAICRLDEAQAVRPLLAHSLSDRMELSGVPEKGWILALDPVIAEVLNGEVLPFFPEGEPTAMSVTTYRLFEFLKQQAAASKTPVSFLPWREADTSFPFGTMVVVAGKYLARASFETIVHQIQKGGRVFFPFGLPQYDERLDSYDWASAPQSLFQSENGEKFLCFQYAEGSVWIPPTSFQPGEDIWHRISQAMQQIVSWEPRS